MSANLQNPAVATRLEKVNPHPSSQEGQKECSHHWTIVLISHARKIMLKVLHATFQHYTHQ